MTRQPLLAFGAVLLLAGCGRMQKVVRQRAAFDMNCPTVQVSSLGGRAFGASGCGRQLVYQCIDIPWVGIRCDPRPPAPGVVAAPPAAQ